jgi:hypothetical protein
MGICLAAAGLVVHLGTSRLTLAWHHSVQKTLWEEDWRETPAGLVLDQARIHSSGAGMDPPEDARFVDGAWRWTPHVPPQHSIVMRRSGATADWQVCIAGKCRPMGDLLPGNPDPVTMEICPDSKK